MSSERLRSGVPPLDDCRVAAVALAALPGVTPARLRTLLDVYGDPRAALDAIAPDTDLEPVRARLTQRGTCVWIRGDDDHPITEPIDRMPAVLFGEGERVDALHGPRVAIVGTRSATPHGLADARELGAFLAASGVTVISGLAIGIDGAAHEGALEAGGPVIGVVATGLDVVYPRRHGALTARVRGRGMLLSEYTHGVQPHRGQFPERNRIIAALAQAVVVVEATLTGGARITAEYAATYGREVFAVPGARRNPAAAGCNALIADGAQVLLDPGDVLVALGHGRTGGQWRPPDPPPADTDEQRVLAAFAGEPADTDVLLQRTGLGPERLAGALRRLQQAGRVQRHRTQWWPS